MVRHFGYRCSRISVRLECGSHVRDVYASRNLGPAREKYAISLLWRSGRPMRRLVDPYIRDAIMSITLSTNRKIPHLLRIFKKLGDVVIRGVEVVCDVY